MEGLWSLNLDRYSHVDGCHYYLTSMVWMSLLLVIATMPFNLVKRIGCPFFPICRKNFGKTFVEQDASKMLCTHIHYTVINYCRVAGEIRSLDSKLFSAVKTLFISL